MMEKSYVSMEQAMCLVCCQKFDTGSILMDRRMEPSMERHTVTGWGLCEEHTKLDNEGYVALIEIDPKQSEGPPSPRKGSTGPGSTPTSAERPSTLIVKQE